jgi:chromosome segregation ATPase
MGSTSSKNKELTQANAKKKIGLLKKESKVLAEESSQYSMLYEDKKQKLQEVTAELENMTVEYGNLEETCHNLQNNINNLLYQKQLLQERISYRQKFSSKLKELTNTMPTSMNHADNTAHSLAVERKLISSLQSLDNVKEIIFELMNNFPHLKEVLERVMAMTDPCIDLAPTENEENDYNRQ